MPPTCTASTCVSTVVSGLYFPTFMSLDANQNIYLSEQGSGGTNSNVVKFSHSAIDLGTVAVGADTHLTPTTLTFVFDTGGTTGNFSPNGAFYTITQGNINGTDFK